MKYSSALKLNHIFRRLYATGGYANGLLVLYVVCLGVGINMEPIFQWGPWMDVVSIYIIPIGATLGALSWFWVMKKDQLLGEINKGTDKAHGSLWHSAGRYLYVPCTLILCCVALFMKVAF